jgi:hypothetical protein
MCQAKSVLRIEISRVSLTLYSKCTSIGTTQCTFVTTRGNTDYHGNLSRSADIVTVLNRHKIYYLLHVYLFNIITESDLSPTNALHLETNAQ